jgi:hypothetical protein
VNLSRDVLQISFGSSLALSCAVSRLGAGADASFMGERVGAYWLQYALDIG